MSEVLVTGGSGFIGAHCILQLLAAGHRVRTTVRNLARRDDVLAMLQRGGAVATADLAFHAADLTADTGWAEAVTGCDTVLHVASPLPLHVPRDENELIVPAREGTLRVLRAARDAGVKRVVLTSSFAAIGYGHAGRQRPFDETDWTDRRGNQAAALREVEGAGGARGLGLHRARRRRAGACDRQPDRSARAGAGTGFLVLDPSGEDAARRQGAGRAQDPISGWSTCATSPTCICAR